MFTTRLDTLGRRLTGTVLACAVLPVLLVGLSLMLFAGSMLSDVGTDRATEELSVRAASEADRVSRSLSAPLTALTTVPGLFARSADSDMLSSTLTALHRDSPWVEGIALLAADGTPQLTAGRFQKQSSSLPGSGISRLPIITDVTLATDGRPKFHMIDRLPADPDKRLICLDIDAMVFSTLLDRLRIGRTGEIFLINTQGMLQTRSVLHGAILDRVDSALAQTATQAAGIRRRDWQDVTLWYRVLPVQNVPGWFLVAQRDAAELFGPRDRGMTHFLLAGLAGLAVLLAASAVAVIRTGRLSATMRDECLRNAEHVMLIRKLDAISQLGVGIAHEVNNPLAIIGEEAGWMQDVLKRPSFADNPDAGELRDSLRQISLQTARSREITHKLLSFGGRTDGIIRDTDLNTLIRDTITLRRREASERQIEIKEDLTDKLPIILSEPALLRQTMINLINNAMDAMPEGGTITICSLPLPDGGARFTVRDSGFGIPEENMDKVCEPFFSTKAPGKGAGLGLSMCHGIMQRIGGRMFLESRPGLGTTVSVDLPLEARPLAS